jgi:Fe-S-cluster containining protein
MKSLQSEINDLANKARESISEYCYQECGAYCCRKGYLTLTDKELSLFLKDKVDEFITNGQLTKTDKRYCFHLGKLNDPCPCLVDNKCTIHKNKLRPQCCKDFPVFVDSENKVIRFSPRCFAVKANKLYAYEKEFIRLGFKLNKFD